MLQRTTIKALNTAAAFVLILGVLPSSRSQADLACSAQSENNCGQMTPSGTIITTTSTGLSNRRVDCKAEEQVDFASLANASLESFENAARSGKLTQFIASNIEQIEDATEGALDRDIDLETAMQEVSYSLLDTNDSGPDTELVSNTNLLNFANREELTLEDMNAGIKPSWLTERSADSVDSKSAAVNEERIEKSETASSAGNSLIGFEEVELNGVAVSNVDASSQTEDANAVSDLEHDAKALAVAVPERSMFPALALVIPGLILLRLRKS